MSSKLHIKLSSEDCLSLAQIMDVFRSPITEEFAWALSYLSARCGQKILTDDETRDECHLVTSSTQILIHKDGYIHPNTFLNPEAGRSEIDEKTQKLRIKCSEEMKILSNLVTLIYMALDYGLPQDVERVMSPELESLLDSMLPPDDMELESNPRSNDEFMSAVHPQPSSNFKYIIQDCIRHLWKSRSNLELSPLEHADYHYKDVCRNYVEETLELIEILENIAKHPLDSQLPDPSSERRENATAPHQLDEKAEFEFGSKDFTNWARGWAHVLRDLKNGVKLKRSFHAELQEPPKLTPYELLMEDIRACRYRLKRPSSRKFRPIKPKDPLSIVLEHIQSKKTVLRKAEDRILNPPPDHDLTPNEQLMNAIREGYPLAHVPSATKRRSKSTKFVNCL